jgi:hypothetical protein
MDVAIGTIRVENIEGAGPLAAGRGPACVGRSKKEGHGLIRKICMYTTVIM